MGLQFGNLPVRIRRVVYYSLSPIEQQAWAKSMTHGIPNLVNRALHALPTVLPGVYQAKYKKKKIKETECYIFYHFCNLSIFVVKSRIILLLMY